MVKNICMNSGSVKLVRLAQYKRSKWNTNQCNWDQEDDQYIAPMWPGRESDGDFE